jgi:hypothetical protein
MSKFLDAFEKKAKEHYANAREAEAGSNRITLKPGTYYGSLTYTGEVITTGKLKGVPQLIETVVVDEGEYVGSSVQKKMAFSEDYAEDMMKALVKRLKTLFPEDADDLSQFDHGGIKEYVGENVLDRTFRVQFSVIENDIEERDGPNKGQKRLVKYYALDARLGDAEPAAEAPAPAKKAKAAPAPEPEDADEEETDDEGDWTPSKGDTVFYKPPGKRRALEFTVVTVNAGKRTVTLKDEEGEKLLNIEFDKLEPADDEE